MSEPNDEEKDEAERVLERCADMLGEHYEAVIILVSRDCPHHDKFSQLATAGRGSWFAQRGMMREVLENDTARTIARHIKAKDE